MDRMFATAAVAALVLWQSSCLGFEDGALVNRCGLWQRLSGQPMVVALGPLLTHPVYVEREKIIYQDRVVTTPEVIYRDRIVQMPVVVPQQSDPRYRVLGMPMTSAAFAY